MRPARVLPPASCKCSHSKYAVAGITQRRCSQDCRKRGFSAAVSERALISRGRGFPPDAGRTNPHCIGKTDGIIEDDIEKTIRNLGTLGSTGMQAADRMILDIMLCK